MLIRTVVVSFILAAGVSAPLASAQAGTPTQALYGCINVVDDAARLACFDREIAALKQREEVGDVATIDASTVREAERRSFGFEAPRLSTIFRKAESEANEGKAKPAIPAEVSEITMAVVGVSVHPVTGKATVTLEDGQVWEQTDSGRLSSSRARNAKEANVTRAALGSFMLKLDNNAAFRARRVR